MKTVVICSYIVCSIIAWFYWEYKIALSWLLVLWLIDTLTGVVRYYRLWRLQSKAIWYGTVAKAFMLIIPFMLYSVISISAPIVAVWSLSMVFTILWIAEFISIIQNIQVVRTGVDVTEQDAVSKILNTVLTYANIILDKSLWALTRGTK